MPFLDGAVLTASDLNNLDNRTVATFASTTARDAALPAPTTGRVCVVAGELQVYRSGYWTPVGPRVARKLTDESRANDAGTAWNDAQLTINPLTPGLWRVEAILFASGDPAADIKIAWGIGTGTEYDLASRSLLGPAAAATSADAATMQTRQYGITGAIAYGLVTGQVSNIREDLLVNIVTSCTVRVQWNQQTTSATATVMKAGSRLYATKLS